MLYFLLMILYSCASFFFFFFNDTATTEIYTLSLHDALPISHALVDDVSPSRSALALAARRPGDGTGALFADEIGSLPQIGRAHVCSSHGYISYAVFCLKKKKKIKIRLYSDK